MRFVFAFCLMTGPVFAQDCPAPEDHSARLSVLIAAAQKASNELEGRQIGQQMWALWADAPDEPSQEILDRGIARRESYDFLGAMKEFDRLVSYCPDYAEGYNQRAFVNYIRQDYSAALPDLDQALVLSPHHVAARAGKALTLMQLGRIDAAREQLKQALELNPWLSERHLMGPGGPLEIKGQDI